MHKTSDFRVHGCEQRAVLHLCVNINYQCALRWWVQPLQDLRDQAVDARACVNLREISLKFYRICYTH